MAAHRTIDAVTRLHRSVVAGVGTALAVIVLSGCSSSSTSHSTSSASGGASESPGTPQAGCVSQSQAQQIWTQIDNQLNAIVLDPKHAGLGNVATGNALALIQQYIQTTLVQANLTEKEVDRLDALTVLNAGCNNGTLTVHVTMTVTRDDYLTPTGKVDHSDPQVGATLHLDESYMRAGSSWKESDFTNLDAPSQTPQLVSA
jgi:hypothetical protein